MRRAIVSALLVLSFIPSIADAQSLGATCTAAQATAANSACNANGCFICTNNSGVYTWVQQALYLGASSATCNPANAGLVQWTGSAFQGCNGSAWSAFGSAAAAGSSGYLQYNSSGSFAGDSGLFWSHANQNLGIGTSSPNASAVLDLSANTTSMLIPVGTTGQEPTCNSALQGAVRYNSSTSAPEYCNGAASAWTPFKATGGPQGSGYFVLSTDVWNGCMEPAAVSSITYSGTTATVTTSPAHGLSTGTSITMAGASPSAYNGTFTITVTGTTTFTYVMASNPGANATVGYNLSERSAGYCTTTGGLAMANARCLTELTTHTGWFGYAQANAGGLLTSSHVKAFLCDTSSCNSLDPSTVYYMSFITDATSGGSSFTTNSSGLGPNDSANWATGGRFGGTSSSYSNINGIEIYWTGRSAGTATLWSSTPSTQTGSNLSGTCNGWTSAYGYDGTSGYFGAEGYANSTGVQRWLGSSSGIQGYCGNTYNLICLVNP